MNDSHNANIIKEKVAAAFLNDLTASKRNFKYYLVNLEDDDEEKGLLTVYCFDEEEFVLFSEVTENDHPTIIMDHRDIESSIFQTLNPELFAGLEKINKLKRLNDHARLIEVNALTSRTSEGGILYTLEMTFRLKKK